MKSWGWTMVAGLALALSSGCATYVAEHAIPTAGRATPDWGTLKVYATDNVPFEYEEIGFVAHAEYSDHNGWLNEQALLNTFRDKVIRMGADALLNFRYDTFGGDWACQVSGVAVKIKRP